MVAFCYWMNKVFSPSDEENAGRRKRKRPWFSALFLHSSNSVTVTATEGDYFSCQEGIGNLSFVTSLWQLSESGVSTFFYHDRVKEEFQGSGKWSKRLISFQWYYWGEAKFPGYSHKGNTSNTQWKQRYVQRSMSREKKISQSKTRIKNNHF